MSMLKRMPSGSNYVLWVLFIWAASFVLSALFVVIVLVKLPPTYFLDRPKRQLWVDQHLAIRTILRLLKNLVGLFLVAAGVLLSLPGVPGQGILTVAIGIILLDFPGKRRLERSVVSRPRIGATIDRIRRRFGQPPLQFSEEVAPSGPE